MPAGQPRVQRVARRTTRAGRTGSPRAGRGRSAHRLGRMAARRMRRWRARDPCGGLSEEYARRFAAQERGSAELLAAALNTEFARVVSRGPDRVDQAIDWESPLWYRPSERTPLAKEVLQVVGHTPPEVLRSEDAAGGVGGARSSPGRPVCTPMGACPRVRPAGATALRRDRGRSGDGGGCGATDRSGALLTLPELEPVFHLEEAALDVGFHLEEQLERHGERECLAIDPHPL